MKIGKAILLTVLLLVLEAVFHLLSYLIFDTKSNPENLDHIRGATILMGRLLAYLIIFYFFWKPGSAELFFSSKEISISVISLILLIIIGSEFLNRPFADLDRLLNNAPANFVYEGYSTYKIYGTITALIIAPVFEELFFRGFLFKKLVRKNNFLIGLFVSSVLFSIIHWETPLNLIPAFIMGLISAVIFYKTGNIFYSILLHFLYNFSNHIYYYNAQLYSVWLNWLDFGILYWSLFIFGIFITLLALRLIPITGSQNLLKNEIKLKVNGSNHS